MDFTEVGVNALRYALHAFPNASYSVLHVRSNLLDMSEPFPVKEQKLSFDTGIFKEQDWQNAMRTFIKQKLDVESLPILLSVIIKYGSVVSEINKYIDRVHFDAIVMGTRDKYNYFEKFLGTVSYSVAKSCAIPMYLIPKHATFQGVNKVLVAIDYDVENTDFVSKYKAFNDEYFAETKFLYVKSKSDQQVGLNVESIVNKMFEETIPGFDFQIAECQDENIGQALLASSYDFKSDLLVVMPVERGLIGSIFFKSISKDLIMKSELPILFIK